MFSTFIKLGVQSIVYYINYHFVSVKFLLSKTLKWKLLVSIIAIVPTILFMMFNTIMVTICAIYKMLVFVILTLIYGKRFQRFVPGCGVITAFSDIDYGHVNVLTKLTTSQTGSELFEDIAMKIKDKIYNNEQKRELFSIRKQKLGYHFFLSTEIQLDEVFTEITTREDEISQENFMFLAGQYFNSPLPLNNEFVWDMALCTIPIAEESGPVTKTYAFMIRIDHAFSDGIAIYNFLSNSFTKADPEKDNYMKKLTRPNEKTTKLQKGCPTHIVNLHKSCWKAKELIWSDNTLNNGVYLGASKNCLWKIKEIRKRFPGVSFLNVIYSAYSACLAEYFLTYHKDNVPENIVLASPIQMNPKRIRKLLTEGGKNDFDNDFSCFIINCPILIDNDKNVKGTLIERMLIIQKQLDKVFNSFDIQGLYVCFKVFMSNFPICLISKYLSGMFYGTLVSCVPGGPLVQFFNGARVSNVSYFVPRRHAYAVGMGVLTYGDELQVGFTLDGDKFSSKEQRSAILDQFFTYIDLIYEESVKRFDGDEMSRL